MLNTFNWFIQEYKYLWFAGYAGLYRGMAQWAVTPHNTQLSHLCLVYTTQR